MILDDGSLRQALEDRSLRIEPLNPLAIQPASVDLHLGTTLRRPMLERGVVSQGLPRRLHEIDAAVMPLETYAEGESILIRPGEFCLGVTAEWVRLGHGLVGQATGCSTVARAGLMIVMAGLVDPGFEGTLTLELVNLSPFPLALAVGERIGQLVVARTLREAQRPYGTPGLGSRYQGQRHATAAVGPQPQWVANP